jgi:hypothetical protein
MSDTLKKPNTIPAAIAAIRTLEVLGYTYTEGAEAWKPPVGKRPAHIDKGLMSRMGQQALDGNFWVYQGDGSDHLESLVCPVVIDPRRLHNAIQNCEKLGMALQKIGSALAIMPGADLEDACLQEIYRLKVANNRALAALTTPEKKSPEKRADPAGSYRDATGELVLPVSMCKGYPFADKGGEQC